MILEGLVTTLDPDGTPHLAPMGPQVDEVMERFLLRPFPTSRTYRNLIAHGQGVLHVHDDVLLLALAALGEVDPLPSLTPAAVVRGVVLADACRHYEFEVLDVDTREERVRIPCRVVQAVRQRDFFGFNRAKHAVVEAAILATRTALIPLEEIAEEYRRLRVLVDKTGGPREREAFDHLQRRLEELRRRTSAPPAP